MIQERDRAAMGEIARNDPVVGDFRNIDAGVFEGNAQIYLHPDCNLVSSEIPRYYAFNAIHETRR